MGNNFGKGKKDKQLKKKGENNLVHEFISDKTIEEATDKPVSEVHETIVRIKAKEKRSSKEEIKNQQVSTMIKDNNQSDMLLVSETYFSLTEIESIRNHVRGILNIPLEKDIIILKDNFKTLVGIENTTIYLDRVFSILDKNNSGGITFVDFIKGLSKFSPHESKEEKIKFSFKLMDVQSSGAITKEDTKKMLKACVEDSNIVGLCLALTEENINQIIDTTFAQAELNNQGALELPQYQDLCLKNRNELQFLTIDFAGTIARLEKRNSTKTITLQDINVGTRNN